MKLLITMTRLFAEQSLRMLTPLKAFLILLGYYAFQDYHNQREVLFEKLFKE